MFPLSNKNLDFFEDYSIRKIDPFDNDDNETPLHLELHPVSSVWVQELLMLTHPYPHPTPRPLQAALFPGVNPGFIANLNTNQEM